MKTIPLTKGKVAIVDDDMFEELSQYKWYCDSYGYAVRTVSSRPGKPKTIWMHRVICGTPAGMETDHINEKKLDNRRENLRRCTSAENRRNIKKPTNNTSGYKGVNWLKRNRKWRAEIKVNGKKKHLGCFDDLLAAAHAYDQAARERFGIFAKTNFEAAP